MSSPEISVHPSYPKRLPLTDSGLIAPIERSLKALVPFEVQFQPIMDTMEQRKEEVDRRARVAHEVFGKFAFISFAIRGFTK